MIIKYLQLPFQFDAMRLHDEVAALEKQHWQLHYQKLHYEGEWSALPLRSTEGRSDDVIISPVSGTRYADTVFLQRSPYLQEVLSVFQCPLLAVRLLKLGAGAVIKEHRDADLNFEQGEVRIHIPVITNDEVEFYIDKERIFMREGECWYMNVNLPHNISNNSQSDRIHLVIDATVNDWVKALFAQPHANKKIIPEPSLPDKVKQQMIAQLRLMNTDTANQIADEMENGPKADPQQV